MRRIVNPQQNRLFDSFNPVLTAQTQRLLLDDWPGVFRHVILELMPVEQLGSHLHATMGRPSKELYSMAGLLLLMELMDWTKQEAMYEYCFNMAVHYALNLEPVAQDLSVRTLERYMVRFEEEELASKVMHDVSVHLIKLLDIKIDKQRLDSTHVFSNMASFGRTRLMGVAIKRFLTHLKRHDPKAYELLDEPLRTRYAPGVNQLFGAIGKDNESRRLLRQQVAEDMYLLIRRFADTAEHSGRDTYKSMERIFYEQCEVHEEKVCVKKKTGGNVMQNPSDPGATYDGHKGPGYQVQLSETCHPDNEVQLITCALPQTAVEPDSTATSEVLDYLDEFELLPQEMFVDTHYCSDENVQNAAARGVELVGPTPPGSGGPKDTDQLNIDDFDIDGETEEVICCPAGHQPESSVHDKQTAKTRTIMPESACGQCEYVNECPIKKGRHGYQLDHTAKERRLASRRREESTEVFRERYRIRGGIEGTNSGLKRRTGLGRLRVRGQPRVFRSILLKVAGWNILRAAACAKMREIVYARAGVAVLWLNFLLSRWAKICRSVRISQRMQILVSVQRFEAFSKFRKTA
ncbi:MAG: transposase [Proteobacteria bacterium]|nr:transposase [Pseudomonadota bacterium]